MTGLATIRVGIETSRARAGVGQFTRQGGALVKTAGRMTRSLQNTTKQMNKLGSASSRVRNLLVGFATGFTMRIAIRQMAAFEQSMAQVEALIGKARIADSGLIGGFAALEEKARELGATTIFTAQQAAEGMKFLTLAGFEASETYTAVEDVLNLAAAGALGLGEAADITSNIMKAFSIEADETQRVVDVLANVARRTNTDIRQLGEAIKFAGPVASAVGISIEEAAAAIGLLGNAGLQASLAGTTLRTSLASMLNPSRKAQRALNDMGITTFELQETLAGERGLTGVIELLAKRGLSAADAFTIFNRRGAAGILALVNQAGKLSGLVDILEDSEGAARRMADTMADTLAGDAKIAVAALSELVIQIGDAGLRGALRSTLQFITGFVGQLTGMADKFRVVSAAALDGINAAASLQEKWELLKDIGLALFFVLVFKLTVAFVALSRAMLKNLLHTLALIARYSSMRKKSLAAAAGNVIFGRSILLLGGPIGIFIGLLATAAAAIFFFFKKATENKRALAALSEDVMMLAESIEFLTLKGRESLRIKAIEGLNTALAEHLRIQQLIAVTEAGIANKVPHLTERLERERAALLAVHGAAGEFKEVLALLDKALEDNANEIDESTASLKGYQEIIDEIAAQESPFAHLLEGNEGQFASFQSLMDRLFPAIKLNREFTQTMDEMHFSFKRGQEDEIPGYEEAVIRLTNELEKEAKALLEGTDEYKARVAAQKEADKETKKLADSIEDMNDTLAELQMDLDGVPPAVRRFNLEIAKLLVIMDKAEEGTFDYVAAVEALSEAFVEGCLGSTKLTKCIDEDTKKIKKLWDQATRRMGDALSDFFKDGLDGFDDFADSVVDVFKEMIADLLTLIVQSGIQGAIASQKAGGSIGGGFLDGIKAIVGKDSKLFGEGGIGSLFSFGKEGSFGGMSGTAGTVAGGIAGVAIGSQIGGAFGAGQKEANIGSVLGAAIGSIWGPLGSFIGGILGGAVGGIFFGGKESVTGQGVQLGVTGGAVGGNVFKNVHTSGGLFKSSKNRTELAPLGDIGIDLNDRLGAALDSITAIGASLGEVVDFSTFNVRTQSIGLKGLSEEQQAARIETFLTSVIGKGVQFFLDNADNLSDRLKTVVAGFKTNTEDFISAFEAAAQIEVALLIDPIQAVQQLIIDGSRTLTQVLSDQFDATLMLAEGYDGTIGSLQVLAQSLTTTKQLQLELVLALEQASISIRDLFQSTRQTIEESILSDEEIFDRREDEFDALRIAIENTTDPIELAALSTQANRALLDAFNLLDEFQRIELVPGFLQALDSIDALVQSQLALGIAEVEVQTVFLDERVTESLLAAAATQLEAAQIQLEAARESSRLTRLELSYEAD